MTKRARITFFWLVGWNNQDRSLIRQNLEYRPQPRWLPAHASARWQRKERPVSVAFFAFLIRRSAATSLIRPTHSLRGGFYSEAVRSPDNGTKTNANWTYTANNASLKSARVSRISKLALAQGPGQTENRADAFPTKWVYNGYLQSPWPVSDSI